MTQKLSTAQRVRALIDKGYNNKAIIEKLKCTPQAVYNIRYQLNKQRGLGSIGTLPKPTEGIGAPLKPRKRKPKRTGIVDAPKIEFNPAQNMYRAGEWVDLPITMFEPEPTLSLWQRVKRIFRG